MCLFGPYLINGQANLDGNLEELVAIEKAIYLEDDLEMIDSLLLIKAGIYKGEKAYQKALNTLDRIVYSTGSNESEIINERILINYLVGNHQETKSLLVESTFIPGYDKTEQIRVVETLNYVALEDFERAKEVFSRVGYDDVDIEDLFDVKRSKNPETAFKLSFIIPGSGQIYAGSFFKGFLSMTVQGALFYTGIQGISRRYFFTEALPGIALFQGFYFGGAEYAKELAVQRNHLIVEQLSLDILKSTKKEASF